MNYILREIKLYKLTGIPLSDEASKFIEFWDRLWDDMKTDIDTDKGEIKCRKEDYIYFYQRDKNSTMWCNYHKVWSFLRMY